MAYTGEWLGLYGANSWTSTQSRGVFFWCIFFVALSCT